ncbi:hypothetical protein PVAP13_2NG076700 [Panicum virgatum]|uniref:Uncharacterized protein n=1 Tax=Panicum virgatum TaxID=38727 RepID=A0A8T0VAI4_PANVG|nr:hypothetical protein PVAP13_2NG076700 [Panicum virgatum]
MASGLSVAAVGLPSSVRPPPPRPVPGSLHPALAARIPSPAPPPLAHPGPFSSTLAATSAASPPPYPTVALAPHRSLPQMSSSFLHRPLAPPATSPLVSRTASRREEPGLVGSSLMLRRRR